MFHQILHQFGIMNGIDPMAYASRPQLPDGLPHALGTGGFSGVSRYLKSGITHPLEMLVKQLTGETQFITGQINRDQRLPVREQAIQLLSTSLLTK